MSELQPNFNPKDYMGKWYEIAKLPQWFEVGCSKITAEYRILSPTQIGVTNTCFDKCFDKIRADEGLATVLDPTQPAALLVNFPPFPPLPPIPNYLVHKTDYCSYALVGSIDRSNLYFLSRNKKMKKKRYEELLAISASYGYDVTKLQINYDSIC